MDFNYKEEIKINRFKLDLACENQSSLYLQYAEELSTVKSELNELKNKVKIVRAEVELNIRRNPPPDLKITEAVIAGLVEIDGKVKEVEQELINKQNEVNHLVAIVESFAQRKDMIRDLVSLQIAGFYSDPQKKFNYDELKNINKE